MKKLKVAIVMPTHFDINSSLNNFIKTYQFLIKKRDVDVTLLTDEKNNVEVDGFNIKKIKGIDYQTPVDKLLFLLGIPRFFYRGLDKELQNYDVINANNPEFYAYSYQAYKAAKKHNKRFILRTSQTVEGFFLYRLTKYIVNPIVKKCYDYTSYNIFTNPQAEERCIKLGLIDNSKKSIITGHATDVDCFKPKKVTKEKNKVLLSVGGLYKIKGHHLIIQALKKLHDSGNKDTELWIVGKGYYEDYLKNLTKELGLEKYVKFLGALGHEKLVEMYNKADVFVLANYQEITPAVNEALACETPVVVMECGGREFVLPDESYGLVSEKFNVDDMAAKVKVLLEDEKKASKIAKKGKKRILEEFSIEKVADKLYKAFTE